MKTKESYEQVTLTTQWGGSLTINAKVVKDLEHITLRQRVYHTDEGEYVLYVETITLSGGRDYKFYETEKSDSRVCGYDDLIERIDHEVRCYNMNLQMILEKLAEANQQRIR